MLLLLLLSVSIFEDEISVDVLPIQILVYHSFRIVLLVLSDQAFILIVLLPLINILLYHISN